MADKQMQKKEKLFGIIQINKYGNSFKKKLFIFCLLVIPISNFLIFTVYANIGGIINSMSGFSMQLGKEVFVGIDNYMRFFQLFKTLQYDRMLMVSLGYFLVILFVSLPFSLVCSFFLYKKVPFGKLIVVILFLPNIIPMSLNAEFFRQLFDPLSGLLSKLFNSLGGYTIDTAPSWLSDPKYSNYMLYLYTFWFGFGYNAILLWGAMTRIPKEVVESAELDGAGFFTEFFKITIPIIWPTLSMLIVLACMSPFTVYMQPLMIAFNGQANTTTIALLTLQMLRDNFDPYNSAAISILMAAISIPIVLIIKSLLEKVFSVVEI